MIAHTYMQIDPALMHAPDAEKIGIALARREFYDLTHSQSQRDEWQRAFWRQLLIYVLPGDFRDIN